MSVVGQKKPPYRPKCGGWPDDVWNVRSCFNHYRQAESSIAKHKNVTRVKDYASPPGDPIPPYPRQKALTGAACASDPVCTDGQPLCGPWPNADRPNGSNGVACADPDATHETILNNCFVPDTGTLNLALCRKMGFKNVQAVKAWHGRFGPMHLDLVTIGLDLMPAGYSACTCSHAVEFPERTVVDGTKYRTLEYTETFTNPIVTRQSYRKFSVEAFTGREVKLAGSDSGTPATGGALGDPTYAPDEPLTLQSCIDMFFEAIGGSTSWTSASAGITFGFTPPVAADISGSTLGEWSFSVDQRDGSGNGPVVTVALSVAGGYFHSTSDFYENVGGVDGTHTEHYTKNLDLTTDTSTLEISDQGFGGSKGTYGPITLEIITNWLDSYTQGDVYAKIKEMLANWDLTDDKAYPWRMDDYPTIAPMVRYDETLSGTSPHLHASLIDNDDGGLDNWWAEGYTAGVANPALFSGELRGTPMPAGYDTYFDWDHVTWRCCFDEDLGRDNYYEYAYGAYSGHGDAGDPTDSVVPGTATKWTENHGSLGGDVCFPGAWMSFNNNSFLWAQKWAEIKIPRPSYNFFGPCGLDRFRFFERLVGCIDSYDAGTKTVTLIHPISGLTSGICMLCGVDAAVDGVWAFTRTDDSHYVLTGTRITDNPVVECVNPTFGKLRFPSAWPICGRVAVTSQSAAGGTVTINCGSVSYLRTGDAVDFTDASGSVTDSNKTVTVVSDTQFTFSGSLPSGGYVISHGAPAWWWYDTLPKGSYLHCEWTHNFRDYQERARVVSQHTDCGTCGDVTPADSTPIRANQALHDMPQSVADMVIERDCIRFTPCSPQVMCSSPNGETWESGTTFAWPESFPLDVRYGSLWQCAFIQEIVDFSYQATGDPETESEWIDTWDWPHKPCHLIAIDDDPETVFPTTWNQDDGTCHPNVDPDYYYRYPPLIEPEIALPVVGGETAPLLPSGCFIGFLSLSDLDTSGDVSGNILLPPVPIGSICSGAVTISQVETPWNRYALQQVCVCSDTPGQFQQEYKDDLVLCP